MSAPSRFGTLRGIFLLATWRREGMANFADTRQGFLNSLAPLLALPLVGFLLLAAQGQFVAALSNLLLAVVVLLGPLMASQAIARWWRRDAGWSSHWQHRREGLRHQGTSRHAGRSGSHRV